MITRAHFKNYRALRDVQIPLSHFTLIIGPNASGKTSILKGIDFAVQMRREDRTSLMAEFNPDEVTKGGSGPLAIRLEGDTGWVWQIGLQKPPSNFIRDGQGVVSLEPSDTRILQLEPRKIAEPSYTEQLTAMVSSDGEHVASLVADIASSQHEAWAHLQAQLRAVVPNVRGCGARRAKVKKQGNHFIGHELVFDFAEAKNLPASLVSEGTLITLALLAILAAPDRPRILLVDELERGLHPRGLGSLVAQLRRLQQRFPDVQIIATTHSPYLVDHFEANEVILTALRDAGDVVVGRLDEHPEFERWKEEMSPGEFWSTVGEDWLKNKPVEKVSG